MNNSNSPSIPETMRAFVLTGHGDLDKLVFHNDFPTPVPGPDDVLIKVHACGLNNTDVNTRSGWYSKTVTEATTGGAYDEVGEEDPAWGGSPIVFPRIQGGDAVGTVVDGGENLDRNLIGKRVLVDTVIRDWTDPGNLEKCGYLGSECDGGFADYMCVDRRNAIPIECGLAHEELATFAIAYSTAENLLTRAKVKSGDSVLIPGASGGVGSALVQLANRRGAITIAMASESKHEEVAKINPTHLLTRNPENLSAALQNCIGTQKVDVVADVVGGDQFGNLIDSIKRGGRYTCAGAIAGPMVELDLRTLYLNDLTFTGCTILEQDIFPNLVGYIEQGEIKPMLAAAYPLEELHAAQTEFIEKKHTGNIVVTMDDK